MDAKKQNPVKELFSNLVKIGKAFEEIWLFKENRAMVEKTLAEHRCFLVEANGENWVKSLERKLSNGRDFKYVLAYLSQNYREWQKKFLTQCDEFNKNNLPEPHCFNKAANALLNIIDLFDSGLERKKVLMNKIEAVLLLFPDRGYDPEEDQVNFKDKVFNGALLMGGEAIIELRMMQVMAEENYKLAKQPA